MPVLLQLLPVSVYIYIEEGKCMYPLQLLEQNSERYYTETKQIL